MTGARFSRPIRVIVESGTMDRKQILTQGIIEITALVEGKDAFDLVPIWKGTGTESAASARQRIEQFKHELSV